MSKVKSTWFPDLDLGNRQRGNEEENSTEQVKDNEKNGRSRCSDLDLGNRQRGNEEENSTEQVKDNENNGRSRRGCCLFNICLRYKYGKQLVERKKEIEKLREKGNFQGGAVTNRVSRVQLIPAQRLEEETSMYYTLLRLQKCICDDSVRIIGVWGMPGVGKTTLLENLNNVPALESLFKIIIFVTVSQKWSPEEVRGKIARRLGLDIERETVETARSMVFQKMKDMKYLLILDDVWEKVNLHQIGVPMNNDNTKGKLVLASRFLGVCQGMNTEEDIGVKPLKRQEAWELFVEKVGEIPSDIEPVAKDVVDQCGNLPIAILAVGGQLRGKQGIQIWNNKLKELCSPSNTDIGLNDDVTKLLKLSYNHLGGDDAKNCFLYSALYTDMIIAEELIDHWVMEGYIGKSETLARSRELGHNMLQQLIETTLLRRGGKQGQVEMHELHRDMALSIATGFLVWNGGSYPDAALDGQWECANRVSLVRCGLRNLPNSPNCPELLTLLLQGNRVLRVIPEDFFARMPQLCILDLSETRIISLPWSISALVNLKALLLRNCERLALLPPEVGRLTQLEFIDLRGTRTSYLPNEFIKLSRLRTLQVTFTNLQYLSVQYLLKLVSIWHQPIPGGSFSGLRTLIVGGCSNLEIVIPKEMALNLSNLEELRVFSCRKVKIIIKGEPMLPKLKYLVLFSMPELKRICEEASKWPSLQVVYASSCPNLTRLPLLLDGIPSLGVIGGEENWWHSLTWEEKFMKEKKKNNLKNSPYPDQRSPASRCVFFFYCSFSSSSSSWYNRHQHRHPLQ
ncbi:Disease resistance protein [Acorus gramineus]|uniref:Disease resistance protein n=1 Tax=Acorus gramineus TaxID=55184 RepID=A0AAV9B265_ACOGR|nr:Disease resistance protein [Acorus gramineus]